MADKIKKTRKRKTTKDKLNEIFNCPLDKDIEDVIEANYGKFKKLSDVKKYHEKILETLKIESENNTLYFDYNNFKELVMKHKSDLIDDTTEAFKLPNGVTLDAMNEALTAHKSKINDAEKEDLNVQKSEVKDESKLELLGNNSDSKDNSDEDFFGN